MGSTPAMGSNSAMDPRPATSSRQSRRARVPRPAAARADRVGARAAGLRYLTDERAGIRRLRTGRGFKYRSPKGSIIDNRDTLSWLRSLAIPPAWTDVWISPQPDAHLLATGRDQRGRKVYRYHPRFRAVRERVKFQRMIDFGGCLPLLRRRVDADLGRAGLGRGTVAAAVVRLLELTLIRVGNDEYARANRSFGLTTLRNRHVTVGGSVVRFHFRGKAGRLHEVPIRDRRLATIVERCRAMPGRLLFQYLDEAGRRRGLRSSDVNAYLREAAGRDLSTKDFRTWYGTVLAYRALRSVGLPKSERDARRRVKQAVDGVAEQLGNTSTIARNSYVHPLVVDAYVREELPFRSGGDADVELAPSTVSRREELAVLRLLRKRSTLLRETPSGDRSAAGGTALRAETKPQRRRPGGYQARASRNGASVD